MSARSLAEGSNTAGRQRPSKSHDAGSNPVGHAPGLSADEFRAANGLARIPDVSGLPGARIPVVYEDACRAIAACTTIDEAKYWSDKADALAAWAKIYTDDRVAIEAKRLKLHSYRRIAELADQIMPEWRAERGFRTATVPIVLKDHGFGETQARVIAKIGEMPRQMVQRAIDKRKPPTPSTLAFMDFKENPKWERIKRTLSSLVSMTDGVNARKLARSLSGDQRARAAALCDEAFQWCYEVTEELEAMRMEKIKEQTA